MPAAHETPKERLTLEKAVHAFSRSLSAGQSDLTLTYRHYHQDVRFQDSVQRTEGLDAFVGVIERLSKRCTELSMEVTDAAQNGDIIFIQWTMWMKYWGTTRTPIHGMSKLTLDADGLIIEQRDVYDMWGDTFDVIPGFGRAYRRFMHRFFG